MLRQHSVSHDCSCWFLSVLPAGLAGAQTASGVIQGTIEDAQGGALPGVTLTVPTSKRASSDRA